LVIHHLAVDGVSWRVLLADLERGYGQARRGEVVELGEKTTSIKGWAERLSRWARSEEAEGELGYWRAAEPSAALPREGRGDNVTADEETVSVALSAEDTEAFLREVPPVYRTQVNDALLLALAEAFEGWTESSKLRIDLEGHGREELFADADVTRTVGWFTSLYPVVLDVSGAAGPGERLKAIKEQLRAIPRRGLGYGALKYLGRPEIRAELAAHASPEVSFNYLGQVDQDLFDTPMFRHAGESTEPKTRDGIRVTITGNYLETILPASCCLETHA
jgi:hypothetical protein